MTEKLNASRTNGELVEADRDKICHPSKRVPARTNWQDVAIPVPVGRSLSFLLRDTSKLMRRRFVQRAKETGLNLNRSEAAVLVHVSQSPGTSQAKLASALDIETISVVRLIDTLQEAGLIERRPHPTDRRIRTLWLTPAAEQALAQIQRVANMVDAQALADIPERDHQRLLQLLDAIKSNLGPANEPANGQPGEDSAA